MQVKVAVEIARFLASKKGRKLVQSIVIIVICMMAIISSAFEPVGNFINGVERFFSQEENIDMEISDDSTDIDKFMDGNFNITETKYYKNISKSKDKYIKERLKELEVKVAEIKEENKFVEEIEVEADLDGNGFMESYTEKRTKYPEVTIRALNPPIQIVLAYFFTFDNSKEIKIKQKEVIEFFRNIEKEEIEVNKLSEESYEIIVLYQSEEEVISMFADKGILKDEADIDLWRISIERISEFLLEAGVWSYDGVLSGSISDVEIAKQIWDFLKSKGWSDYATAAVLGNIEAESGFKTELQERGGTGIGLFQWSYKRRNKLLEYLHNNGYQLYDIHAQLEFLIAENVWYKGNKLLYNSDGIYHQSKANSLEEFSTYNYANLSDAVDDFCWHWESPNYKLAHMDRRQGAAADALAIFTGEKTMESTGSYSQIKASFFPSGKLPTTAEEMARYLMTISFTNSAGVIKRVTVHKSVAVELAEVLRSISEQGYEIREISGYNFRNKVGSGSLSSHSYGLAIDINYSYGNPFVKNGKIIVGNVYGSDPLSMKNNSIPVRELKAAGWKWGGEWKNSKDYMHFSIPGD